MKAKKQRKSGNLYKEAEHAGRGVALDPNMTRNKIGYGGMKPINLTQY